MKFQKSESFEKHFKEAFPKHLSSVYAIVCRQEHELKKILESLTQFFMRECDVRKCEFIKDAIEHLNTGSLFSNKMVAVFDRVDLLSKTELEGLDQYISSPNPQAHLLLGALNSKNVGDLYKKSKREMVVLDLSLEKPWEEKQRLEQWLFQVFYLEKKQIAPNALEALFERIPNDRLTLQREIEKLICYVGERSEVTLLDVEAICSPSEEYNLFQIAQQLVWERVKSVPSLNDLAFLLPLIGQLRNQLEMGLIMSTLLNKGASNEEISSAFPRLWPKLLNQCLQRAQTKGANFFKQGLIDLFDFEFGLKTNRAKPEVLFTIFCTKLSQ